MRSLRIICLLAMIQFAFAGSSDDDAYDGDNTKEVIIKHLIGPWNFPSHIQAAQAFFVDSRYLYTSGVFGIDSYGNYGKTLKAQIVQIIINLTFYLDSVKLKYRNVIALRVAISADYYEQFLQFYQDYFPKIQLPTVIIFIAELPKGAFIQVSLTAVSGNIKWIPIGVGYDGHDGDEY